MDDLAPQAHGLLQRTLNSFTTLSSPAMEKPGLRNGFLSPSKTF